MKIKTNLTINKLYSLIGIIVLIITIFLFSIIFYKFKRDFLKLHIRNQVKLVNDFTKFFQQKFESQLEFLLLLKYSKNIKEAENLKYFSEIYVVNLIENKIVNVIKSKYNPELLKGTDVSFINNLPLIKLKLSKNLFITPLYFSEFLGKKVVGVILPLENNLNKNLCIIGEINFQNILKNIFKKFANREDIIIITDLQNNFIESSHPNFFYPKITFTEIKFNNRIYTVVGKVFPELSLRIFYLSPIATSIQILFQNVIIVIFILLIILFLLYFIVNKKLIIEPLNNIVRQLEFYPDTSIDVESKIVEIYNIKKSFNSARDKINKTINSQKQLLNFLEDIFNSSPLPIVIINKDYKILYSNKFAKKLFPKQHFENIIKEKFSSEVNSCFNNKNIKKIYDTRLNGKIFDLIFFPLSFEQREEIVLVLNDQTEKKILQDKLIKSKKIEIIGLFSSGIAHDLNNIVQSILSSVEMMKINLKNEEKLKNYIDKIENTTELSIDLLNRLRSYAKSEETLKKEVDFKEIINNTLIVVKVSLPYFIKIRTDFDENQNYPVKGDKFELTQVLMNLILNAKDAIIESGKDKGIIEILMRKEDKNLIITIKDNGIGIREENINKIFDIFYSSKNYISKEKGTGIGLSITKKIVEKYNGKIEVSSIYGEGTTFKLIF